MNIVYLNSLPEVENKYNVNLQEGEKVVFAAGMPTFGTEKDNMIGSDCDFTLTNQRMLIDNHAGVWTIDIVDDIAGCTKVQGGFLVFKYTYFSVVLNEEVVFDNGRQKLSGFHFYFEKEETKQFEEIMNNLLN